MDTVPAWIVVLAGITAFITAIGLAYSKFIKPTFLFAMAFVEAIPIARQMVAAFDGVKDGFAILSEIVGQVRNDSGSSLLDTTQRVDRVQSEMQATLTAMQNAAMLVAVGTESAKQLAERDRGQLLDIIKQLDRVTTKVETIITSRANVASQLTASQKRADSHADSHEPGAAADAAAGSPNATRKPAVTNPPP